MGDTQMEEVKVAIEDAHRIFKANGTIIDREPTLIDIEPEERAEIEKLVRETIIENLDNMEADEIVQSDARFMESLVNVQMNAILRGEDKPALEYYRNKIKGAKR